MPELHKNQIQWQAPEPQKVAFDKPNYEPLADAFNSLGRAAKEFSEYQNRIDDVEAKATLDQYVDEGLVELERYEPSDNNYKPALKKFNDGLQKKFQELYPTTQTRFSRDYPMYMQEQNLKAETLVFDKQQKFAIKKAGDMIPLMASNVTEGKYTYEEMRKELEYMTANMNNAVAEEMLFTFDNQVQVGKLNNLIRNGQYQDAIDYLESPKDSDTFTPEFRIERKVAIQNIIDAEVKERESLKKQLTKDIESNLEAGLVRTLLYALDKKDNSYAKLLHALDDPNAKIPLTDEKGNVIGNVTTKDINVLVRRNAMKKSGEYESDSMSWRVNSNKANILAENFEKQYKDAQGERLSGEVFNNVYNFTNSDDFYYLKQDTQKKMLDIVYDEVNRYNEQVLPYSNYRNETTLYGVGKQWTAPSAPQQVMGFVFGNGAKSGVASGNGISAPNAVMKNFPGYEGSAILKPIQYAGFTNLDDDAEQRWFRQLTSVLRDEEEKSSGRPVKYGSELEYLMNIYSALLTANPTQRAALGVGGSTDDQIGLTYARLKGALEARGDRDTIIGQNMDAKQSNAIRKDIFDSFYSMLNNGNEPRLTPEQSIYKQRLYDNAAKATYGTGTSLSFTSTEFTVVDEDKKFSRPLTHDFDKEIKKYKKGEK